MNSSTHHLSWRWIKYLGSKRLLVPAIGAVVEHLGISSAADLFTGTTRVACAFKRLGLRTLANDSASYAHLFARCYIEADADSLDVPRLEAWLAEITALAPVDGYVTRTFAREARFFTVENAMRIDAMRSGITRLPVSDLERAVLLTALIEAADRVDSTVGLQMAYLKTHATRAGKPLSLRLPELLAGTGAASGSDALVLAKTGLLAGYDLAYLDPPYNSHSYAGNYHVWETIARGDTPEAYGVARKRVDVRERKSPFNRSASAGSALRDLLAQLPTPWILVSFSDESFLSEDEVLRALAAVRPSVDMVALSHPRHVGARLGNITLRASRSAYPGLPATSSGSSLRALTSPSPRLPSPTAAPRSRGPWLRVKRARRRLDCGPGAG